jgi:histidine triad (HIT) family protein
MSCVFCEIVAGRAGAEVVYEDDRTLAFLDTDPVAPGHCLVIPKMHFVNVIDAEEEILAGLIGAAKRVGGLLMVRYGATGFNILNASGRDAQQSVFHLHFHVIPRTGNDGLDLWIGRRHTVPGPRTRG